MNSIFSAMVLCLYIYELTAFVHSIKVNETLKQFLNQFEKHNDFLKNVNEAPENLPFSTFLGLL